MGKHEFKKTLTSFDQLKDKDASFPVKDSEDKDSKLTKEKDHSPPDQSAKTDKAEERKSFEEVEKYVDIFIKENLEKEHIIYGQKYDASEAELKKLIQNYPELQIKVRKALVNLHPSEKSGFIRNVFDGVTTEHDSPPPEKPKEKQLQEGDKRTDDMGHVFAYEKGGWSLVTTDKEGNEYRAGQDKEGRRERFIHITRDIDWKNHETIKHTYQSTLDNLVDGSPRSLIMEEFDLNEYRIIPLLNVPGDVNKWNFIIAPRNKFTGEPDPNDYWYEEEKTNIQTEEEISYDLATSEHAWKITKKYFIYGKEEDEKSFYKIKREKIDTPPEFVERAQSTLRETFQKYGIGNHSQNEELDKERLAELSRAARLGGYELDDVKFDFRNGFGIFHTKVVDFVRQEFIEKNRSEIKKGWESRRLSEEEIANVLYLSSSARTTEGDHNRRFLWHLNDDYEFEITDDKTLKVTHVYIRIHLGDGMR